MFEFDLLDKHQNKTRYNFGEGEFVIGKGDQCDVIISDNHVSRVHAQLTVNSEKVILSDIGSTNGTWFQGHRLSEPLTLSVGDKIQFGEVQLLVNKIPFTPKKPAQVQQVYIESEELVELKRHIHALILDYLDLRKRSNLQGMSADELRLEAEKATREIVNERIENIPKEITKEKLIQEVVAEAIGLGALEPLLADDSITEIMINGPDQIYIEQNGRLTLSSSRFTSSASLLGVIDRIVAPLGRRIDESSPMVDARLADGSRVNAIIPPLALKGPTVTIRKFSKKKLLMEDLIKYRTLSVEMAKFLQLCVEEAKNVLISGGTGSGKTTTLNILSNYIGDEERIVTIEDAAELKLNQNHVVALESRPANAEGKGRISIRELVINALRMRPDRIVVGECRGGEALDMLQAMNTGHDGSLTTGHANTPRDFLARLEVMVLMAGVDLPVRAIREQIASAVNFIIQQNRLPDGTRKITHIVEVVGMQGDQIELRSIFEFKRTGLSPQGKIIGSFVACGNIPRFYEEARSGGREFDTSIFVSPDEPFEREL